MESLGYFAPIAWAFKGYLRTLNVLDRNRTACAAVDRDLRLIVSDVEEAAEDVAAIRLTSSSGASLPPWQPGCHLDLHLASGRRRQYSLCGDPGDRSSYRIAVRRLPDGGGGSLEMHALRTGDQVTVRGPRNAFPYVPGGPALFVAGGIGITPILPMVREAARRGDDWHLFYAGRSRASMPFLAELPSAHTTVWTGGIPSAGDMLRDLPDGGAVYCCGPPPMIDSVRLAHAGPLHYERFAPPPVVNGRPFEVELKRSRTILRIPADRTVLDVVREADPDVAYSCRQGFCGTCDVRVIEGEVDHRDRRLTTEERAAGRMLICTSRAKDVRIVIDL